MAKSEQQVVAETILQQIGRSTRMATGARDFLSLGPAGTFSGRGRGGVTFKVGGGATTARMTIVLNGRDLYDIEYWPMRAKAPTKTLHDQYAEDLPDRVYGLVHGQYRRTTGRKRSRIPGVTTSDPGWSIPGVSNGLTRRSTRARYASR